MKLGHISDLHILAVEDVRPWHFLNKRLIGAVNLLMHRADAHSAAVVEQALEHLDEEVDHIAITGDLTNLALPSEFAAARAILDRIDEGAHRISVIPGNHDYYTADAARDRLFETYFADHLHSDLPAYQQPSGYPFCHLREDVAIIGLNSGVPSPPLFAIGRVAADEIAALERLLADPQVVSRFKVALIHHHLLPFEHSRSEYLRRLVNAPAVLRVLRLGQVDLALHGHNHHFATLEVPHLVGNGVLRICEAGSTSQADYRDPDFGGKFNIYHIEGGRLRRIETHLFESRESSFVPWREQTFEQVVSP